MCGARAPLLPAAVPTRFAYKPQASAADVADDVGWPSAPPSLLMETIGPPPPHDDDALAESIAAYKAAALLSRPRQLLMADDAAKGLLPLPPSQQQMARRRRRDRQALMTYHNVVAPPPPPLKTTTRFVANTTTTPAAAAADAMADFAARSGGFSAPTTPSYRSRSSSSSSSSLTTTTPSASPSSLYSAAAAAWSNPPPTTMPFPTAARPRVGVRQVWAHNFADEATLIDSLLPKFPYAAVDTAFPAGTAAAHTLTPEERYSLLRSTVDALEPTQLGLTLFDDFAAATRHIVVWQFNFRDELDLDDDGVDAAAAFGPRLREWVRSAGLGRGGVVTSRGGYDVAWLVKLMHLPGVFRIPASAAELEAVVAGVLLHRHRWSRRSGSGRVFDVREMARRCPSREEVRRGMDGVAKELNVVCADDGEARRGAGYGSLVTCYTFGKLREICFDDDGKLGRVDGVLGDITAAL